MLAWGSGVYSGDEYAEFARPAVGRLLTHTSVDWTCPTASSECSLSTSFW